MQAADKAFAISLMEKKKRTDGTVTQEVSHPHMEWNGHDFVPQTPAPSPIIPVKATMMEAAHKKLGMSWHCKRKGAFTSKECKGLADTGCQTCTAGTDFLDTIGCP